MLSLVFMLGKSQAILPFPDHPRCCLGYSVTNLECSYFPNAAQVSTKVECFPDISKIWQNLCGLGFS